MTLPDNAGRFMYAVTVEKSKISVASRITLRKPIYFADEYDALRAFYDQIIAKHNEQIVLKKGS